MTFYKFGSTSPSSVNDLLCNSRQGPGPLQFKFGIQDPLQFCPNLTFHGYFPLSILDCSQTRPLTSRHLYSPVYLSISNVLPLMSACWYHMYFRSSSSISNSLFLLSAVFTCFITHFLPHNFPQTLQSTHSLFFGTSQAFTYNSMSFIWHAIICSHSLHCICTNEVTSSWILKWRVSTLQIWLSLNNDPM